MAIFDRSGSEVANHTRRHPHHPVVDFGELLSATPEDARIRKRPRPCVRRSNDHRLADRCGRKSSSAGVPDPGTCGCSARPHPSPTEAACGAVPTLPLRRRTSRSSRGRPAAAGPAAGARVEAAEEPASGRERPRSPWRRCLARPCRCVATSPQRSVSAPTPPTRRSLPGPPTRTSFPPAPKSLSLPPFP